MSGLSESQVMEIRNNAEEYLRSKYGDIDIVNNYDHPNAPTNAGRLWHLGASIQQMDSVDAV